MSLRPFTGLVSVKAKLLAGFLAMSLLIFGVGGYALLSIGNARTVVTDTFDRPLMAVNFARSASQTFTALEMERLRPSDPDAPESEFDWLSEQFLGDLTIAQERSIAPRADDFFADVLEDFAAWQALEKIALTQGQTGISDPELGQQIEDNLDIIVELQTNESFRNRESAIETMERIRRFSLYAVIAALLLTLGLTTWITLTIVRPLKSAADAAAQISAGQFDVAIPKGGDDETGQLLRTMRSMQSNIRTRMEAEQDSRALAQQRLSESLENSTDAVLLTNVDGKVIVTNPRVMSLFPTLLGSSSDKSLIGRDCGTLFAVDGIPLHVDQNGPQIGNEFRLADGRWIRVNASSTREGGRLFIWSDISESKANADRLRIARDEAEAASRAKTLFLAAMSHELNTPLNAIIGLADVMKLMAGQGSEEGQIADMATMISQSGTHMAQIVQDVLEIASDENEVKPDQYDAINLSGPINRAIESLRGAAETANVQLVWAYPNEAFNIMGDAKDLEQLVRKLIDNAIKFNNPGGAVKAQLSAIGEDHIRLDIIDNGPGIAPEHFEKILQPFRQVDEGYSRAVDGTGLGLPVADRIARRHGTELQIQSRVGKGSVFSLTFSRASAALSNLPLHLQDQAA